MAQLDLFRLPRRPWNSGRMIGPKPPFKPKHVWAIRHVWTALPWQVESDNALTGRCGHVFDLLVRCK